MSEFVYEQVSVTTAEDENNYFTGTPEVQGRPHLNAILPPGTYRVVEGSLYRIVGGVPPSFPAPDRTLGD
ncbi:MAG: hypothetical protein Q7R39_05830 [Dehalococcoidia bacterium]|nr:hypothetical protein [Dehalococcoidia bacterium]